MNPIVRGLSLPGARGIDLSTQIFWRGAPAPFTMQRVESNAIAHPAISIREITKRYGKLTAVSGLNLEVHPGEILGFLGLNGAGKTTTIRILLDLLRPASGKASILGHDCQKDGLRARSLTGYLPGELGIYSDMPGGEVLDFLAGLSGQTPDKQYRRELQERLQFPDADLRRKLREYSTGMKRKLGLLQSLEADPPLLILDEPTEGLDPLMQEAFYQLVAELKRRGRTVFMSSHVLSEVARVCDRVALLRKGELALLATVDEIRKLAPRRARVLFSDDVKLNQPLPPGHEIIELKPRAWSLRVEGELGPLLGLLASLPVKDLEVEEAKLEDVLITYYREGSK
ncbi:MAG: ABC transporter ATP-binding protein [Blastocatellia bacterium]